MDSMSKNTKKSPQVKAQLYTDLMTTFRSFFRPEFLNRVDDIVIFDPISQTVLRKIVDTQIEQFITLVKKEKDITLSLTDEAKDELGSV
jgi:ATP-dependent Clp protease ATP-binding subunit ClpB